MKNIDQPSFSEKVLTNRGKMKGFPGDIGIELEIEGKHLGFEDESKYWVSHAEPSLRDGVEYVLREPISAKNLDVVLEEFKALTPRIKIIQSLRTSTHIHINIDKLTLKEMYNVLCHYFLVEDFLVALNGSSRVGNLFCLRASDAFGQISACIAGIRNGAFPMGDNNSLKYGAVNLVAPRKYGSLEFRFPRGAESMDFVKFWAKGLYDLVHINKAYDIRETMDTIDYANLDSLLTKTLPKAFVDEIKTEFTSVEIRQTLSNSIKRVTCVSTVMDQDTFVKPVIRNKGDDLDMTNVMSKELRFPDKVEVTPKKTAMKFKAPPEEFDWALHAEEPFFGDGGQP